MFLLRLENTCVSSLMIDYAAISSSVSLCSACASSSSISPSSICACWFSCCFCSSWDTLVSASGLRRRTSLSIFLSSTRQASLDRRERVGLPASRRRLRDTFTAGDGFGLGFGLCCFLAGRRSLAVWSRSKCLLRFWALLKQR